MQRGLRWRGSYHEQELLFCHFCHFPHFLPSGPCPRRARGETRPLLPPAQPQPGDFIVVCVYNKLIKTSLHTDTHTHTHLFPRTQGSQAKEQLLDKKLGFKPQGCVRLIPDQAPHQSGELSSSGLELHFWVREPGSPQTLQSPRGPAAFPLLVHPNGH